MLTDSTRLSSCSIILFALRALVQLVLFTPKAPPFDPTRNHPFIVAIFGSNLICMLVHKFSTPPEAGEARRGYLHGGLFIDFIGQKAPVSVLRLLLLDILIIFLDLVMLGLVVERVKTAGASEVASTADAASSSLNLDTRQDHDSEERGVLRRETPDPARRSRDLEGTEVTGPQTTEAVEGTVDEDRLERTGLLANFLEDDIARGAEVHPRDRFASGEALIMDAGLFDIIREQWRYTPAEAIRRTSYGPSSETTAFLRDRFGIHVGSDGRILRLGGS